MEFGNLGKHCSETTCHQKDFLPFECKYCKNMVIEFNFAFNLTIFEYCLEHRTPKDHQCKNENVGAKKAIICPMCSKTLKYEFGEDENEIVYLLYT